MSMGNHCGGSGELKRGYLHTEGESRDCEFQRSKRKVCTRGSELLKKKVKVTAMQQSTEMEQVRHTIVTHRLNSPD